MTRYQVFERSVINAVLTFEEKAQLHVITMKMLNETGFKKYEVIEVDENGDRIEGN